MLIYRIEHPETKCGPYNGVLMSIQDGRDSFIDDMVDQHSEDQKNHPVRACDFKYHELHGDPLCACPTLYKLYKWFDGWMDQLLETGFRVYKIEVSKVIMGKSGKQVLFLEEDILSMKIIR